MRTSIGQEKDKAHGHHHTRWNQKQDRHNWKKSVIQHPLQPKMSATGNKRNSICAVMERVHRPKAWNGMLKTMECVLVEIQCHHDKCERGIPPVTFGR